MQTNPLHPETLTMAMQSLSATSMMPTPKKKKGGFKAHPSVCGLCDDRGGNAGRLMGKGMPMQEPSYQATEEKLESPKKEKSEYGQ